ncbi:MULTISPECIES: hypothetical protein [Legionella]|uniref:HEPN domain-containing protein n=1 Tax=Legionella quinlivanii TaxID=45073 RepID=A0A364LKP1_9GAMM|nr:MULTISPECIES: hypothetical protein [Legionella]MCE3045059.1 hypothetical protein [Legionella sp. 16cNR16C]RAP37310.1 hypothetical protein B1207_03805 [Legionella quinlivanii]
MDKHYYSPLELLKIATQHAYAADHLMSNLRDDFIEGQHIKDNLNPISSLMYIAFQLTLQAYLLHVHRPVKQNKTLIELLEMNQDLSFSSQDLQLFKMLSRQLAFRKGVNYELWQTRQQFQVFCADLLDLYERLQAMMPLELQNDYQK